MASKRIFSITYASRCTESIMEEDILKLLESSSLYNKRHKITSILLYGKGDLIQVLEGNKKMVEKLFEEISYDYRHYGVVKLCEEYSYRRKFRGKPLEFRQFPRPFEAIPIRGFDRLIEEMPLPVEEVKLMAKQIDRFISKITGRREVRARF